MDRNHCPAWTEITVRLGPKYAAEVCADAEWMVERYKEIYKLNKEAKDQPPEVVLEKRSEMRPIFEAMKEEALKKINSYSSKSQMADAYNYFIENYQGLTRFLDNHLIPIDNNLRERLLRSHVVGRKTWYGNHSRRSAETEAVHFLIVEPCKMIGVNPREFYMDAVRRIHSKHLTAFACFAKVSHAQKDRSEPARDLNKKIIK